MKPDRPPFSAIFKSALQKSVKRAIFFTACFILAGFVLDGEYKRPFSAGMFFAIIFVSGLIAEWWRPSPIAGERSRPQP